MLRYLWTTGVDDIPLTATPEVTFFNIEYRRYGNFAIETVPQTTIIPFDRPRVIHGHTFQKVILADSDWALFHHQNERDTLVVITGEPEDAVSEYYGNHQQWTLVVYTSFVFDAITAPPVANAWIECDLTKQKVADTFEGNVLSPCRFTFPFAPPPSIVLPDRVRWYDSRYRIYDEGCVWWTDKEMRAQCEAWIHCLCWLYRKLPTELIREIHGFVSVPAVLERR